MNIYTAVAVTDVAIVLGSVAICFASRSAWGLLGFLCLTGTKYIAPERKDEEKEK